MSVHTLKLPSTKLSRGCKNMLGGLCLPHAMLLAVVSAFRRADILEKPNARQKTPPPTPNASLDPPGLSTDAWTVVAEDAQRSSPLTSKLIHPPFFTSYD